MDGKLALIIFLALLTLQHHAEAEFLFNRHFPKEEDLEILGLKCVPGRTVMKIKEKPVVNDNDPDGDREEEDTRRVHMRFSTDDEFCQICVCSVEAKDEYCSRRPAMNVNECMRMAVIMDQFNNKEPYDHERTLAYRIRRDLIWHGDEIPSPPHSRCKRSRSYYSNSVNANDTDVDVASDVQSLIDYNNPNVCFYCVCNTAGDTAGCIPRNPWYCQFFRNLRSPDAARLRYKFLFQHDRPAYFRQLSWRLRRTMDNGMFDLIDNVGDGSANSGNQKCTPFVSMYSDCTEETRCSGCHRCVCKADATWQCEDVSEGCNEEDEDVQVLDEKFVNAALDTLLYDLKTDRNQKKQLTPDPTPPPETILVMKMNKLPAWDNLEESAREEEEFVLENLRDKRAVKAEADEKKKNGTITFHHTVDELNEDTLKNTNATGTVHAAKVEAVPTVARRSSPLTNSSTTLQIEYTPPLIHSQHAADNKVDSPAPHDDQLDLLVHHKIYEMVGNQTQAARDKDLSKIVVNELKGGKAEYIGDEKSPVISNITFTPENDTLTAMAFIAGNLLNKLWTMEQNSDDSLETEHMKHKKIDDLLELFKEPLNLRQETFLKNALQQLSKAIEKKDVGNVSICENLEKLKKTSNIKEEVKVTKPILKPSSTTTAPDTDLSEISQKGAAAEALNKIGNILDLIKKYEQTHNALFDIKNSTIFNSTVRKFNDKDEKTEDLTDDEKTTLNVFGNVLESLTRLIVPSKKSKQIVRGVKGKNIFVVDKDIKNRNKNLNLTGMALTTKDKIVLDYLTHIQNNPNCLLNKPQEKPVLPDVEGDLLQNLSEFLEIKSMSDLLKSLDSENKKEEIVMRTSTRQNMPELPLFENVYTSEATTTKTTITERDNRVNRFESAKKRLKDHLKTILEDIIELQKISGKSVNGKNIEISDALPCIYNLINNKRMINNYITTPKPILSFPRKVADPISKMTEIINNLKKELHNTVQTRRNIIEDSRRPKSAIVWERTVMNMGDKNKLLTRRSSQSKVKSLDEIKAAINKLENSGSNTYKSIAYLAEVPAAERLLLLKTLALDTNKYISVINDIIKSTDTPATIPTELSQIISEFLDNVDINLKLNGKIINGLGKPKKDMYLSNREVRPPKKLNVYNTAKEMETVTTGYNTVKLNRDQIINQLIKNRMLYYLKMMEEEGDKSGMNADLARKILLYLEMGNENLARELFKVFVSQKKENVMNLSTISVSESKPERTARRTRYPEPLIQFEDPGPRKTWMNQDQLMKQLINMKMRL